MAFQVVQDHFFDFDDPYYIDDWIDAKTCMKKNITYLNDIIAFDIETSSFKDQSYDEDEFKDSSIYDYLNGRRLKIAKRYYHDIPDLNYIRDA